MADKPNAVVVELEDRDPNSLSQHLYVDWAEVIGEPEGFRTPQCAWDLSQQCFNGSRNCCYIFLSVLGAPLAALCIGFSFASLSFSYIWCWTPGLKYLKIVYSVVRTVVRALCETIIIPIAEAFGHCFSEVRIRKQNLPDGPDPREDFLLL